MNRVAIRVSAEHLKSLVGITDENTLLVGVRFNPFANIFELLLANPKYERLPEGAEAPVVDITEA